MEHDLNETRKVTRATLGDDLERLNRETTYYMDLLCQARINQNTLKVKADRQWNLSYVAVVKEKDPKGKYGLEKITVDAAKALVDTDMAYVTLVDQLREADNAVINLQSAVDSLKAAQKQAEDLKDLWAMNYFGNRKYDGAADAAAMGKV